MVHVLPLGEPYSPIRGGAVARVVAATIPHLDPGIRPSVVTQWYPHIEWYPGRRYVGLTGRLTTVMNRRRRLRSLQRSLHTRGHPLAICRADVVIVEGDVRLAAALRIPHVAVRFHNVITPTEEDLLSTIANVHPITVSHWMASRLGDHLPELSDRIEVLGGGVDTNTFHPSAERDHSADIVYLGRIAPEKGLLELLDAFEVVVRQRPETRLLIGGGSTFGRNPQTEYLSQVQAKVTELTAIAPESVRLLGPLDHDRDVPGLLRRAAVAALPSVVEEGLSLSALEAMSSGLAVVAANSGGLAEVVGDAGILVDPADRNQLGGALLRVLDDAEEARALGAKARDRVLQEFSWDLRGRQFSNLVSRLAVEFSQ